MNFYTRVDGHIHKLVRQESGKLVWKWIPFYQNPEWEEILPELDLRGRNGDDINIPYMDHDLVVTIHGD